MPAVSPTKLVDAILHAIQKSGGTGFYMSERLATHPREFLIQYGEDTISLWVYIWTLTPGGRPSLPDEYRIQMTSVSSPLSTNPSGHTVLLGYHADSDMFAGFDIDRHRTFTAGSPSVQVDIGTIHTAAGDGLAFSRKDNQEIAVGIRPDQFLNYVFKATSLHRHGGDLPTYDLLLRASQLEDIKPQEIVLLTQERQKIVESISRYARESRFRQQVMEAYGSRCAVTRAQLNLVDAAHIVPVKAQGTDDVSNGIALSPTIHRAYDNSLIYLDKEYYMRLNEQKASELKNQRLDDGLDDLRGHLNSQIHLPANRAQWPNPELIEMANKLRRIQGYY